MTINIAHFKELRTFFRKLPAKSFNMKTWRDPGKVDGKYIFSVGTMEQYGFQCGAVGCIGGWTEAYLKLSPHVTLQPIIEWLGIDGSDANKLFYQYPNTPGTRRVSWKMWILHRLDIVIETGKIDYYGDVMKGKFRG